MRHIILLLALAACSSPREGERINIAGLELEGQAWRVDCMKDTPRSLYRRWIYESPNWCDALNGEGAYEMCPSWYVVRYRYEWAKKEWLEQCAQ